MLTLLASRLALEALFDGLETYAGHVGESDVAGNAGDL